MHAQFKLLCLNCLNCLCRGDSWKWWRESIRWIGIRDLTSRRIWKLGKVVFGETSVCINWFIFL